MSKNKDLSELREWLGLSQDYVEMKKAPCVMRGASVKQTSWLDKPSVPVKRGRPKKVYHDALIDAFKTAEEQENQRIREQATQAIKRTFNPGACYQVRRTATKYRITASRDDPEDGYAFIYLRKEGIHHVFQEAKDGWIRTYTDAQLVGKYVDEVRIQDVLIPVKGGYIYA